MSVRWGVIGCGQIADIETIPVIKEAKNSEIVSVMSRSKEKARKFSSKHNIPRYYTDIEEFLKDPSLDAVYVATPPHLHCEQVRKVSEYGKHILCEKPMAITVEECEKMIEACNKRGLS